MFASSLAAALSVSASQSLSAATQDAKPISEVAPVYSHDLRASGVEGEVVVSFTITAKGDVLNPVVVSSTDRLLEKPTLAAVIKWKFAPAMKDGVPISVRAVQPVAFMIPDLHQDATRLITSNAHPASPSSDSTMFR
jgi:protein TonB